MKFWHRKKYNLAVNTVRQSEPIHFVAVMCRSHVLHHQSCELRKKGGGGSLNKKCKRHFVSRCTGCCSQNYLVSPEDWLALRSPIMRLLWLSTPGMKTSFKQTPWSATLNWFSPMKINKSQVTDQLSYLSAFGLPQNKVVQDHLAKLLVCL